MALAKTAAKFVKKGLTPEDKSKKKGGKGQDFLNGLKDWVTSPGGIVTLVLIAVTIWYVHHKTAEE